jgi:hypothetical protein
VETPPFLSLSFFVFKRIPLVESDPNFMGGDRSEFRPIVSENINFPSFARRERERERERDLGGKSIACIKLLVASKVRESFPKDNRKLLLLKGGPGSRMKQRETTTEEEK